MWILLIVAGVAILLGIGMLIARRNPGVADQVANAAEKAKDAAQDAAKKI